MSLKKPYNFGVACSLVKQKVKESDPVMPCIELEHIESGSPKLNGATTTEHTKSQKTHFSVGDVLFGKCRPYLRKTWFATHDGGCSTEIWALRANKDLLAPEYLQHVVQGDNFNKHANVTSGTKMPRADWKHVKEFPLNLPPLEDQRKIAACLSTWDKAIDAHGRLIALKEKQKRGLMQKYFSKNNNQTVKLNDVCTLKGGSGFPVIHQGKETGVLPFIKVSDMNSVGNERLITRSNNWLDDVDLLTVKPKVMPAKSTVFAKVGAALLLNRRRLLSFDTAIDNNMMAATPNEKIEHDYLFYFMQTIDMGRLVQEGPLPSINQKQVGRIEFPLRPLEEQRKISVYLSTGDDAIDALTKKRDLLKRQKQGLMQQLLS
jgi:type I restriction enzyme S subunit